MSEEDNTYVCPAELSGALDNSIRRWIHNPEKLLKPFITNGMTVLDLGCGPGFFTPALARLAGKEGKVIAADLQQGMLEKMMNKVRGTELETRVVAHLCAGGKTGVSEKVDFVLAFWMVHEVPRQQDLFEELRSILKPGGKIWVIEPKLHVTGRAFKTMTGKIVAAGLEVIESPRVAISRSVLLRAR